MSTSYTVTSLSADFYIDKGFFVEQLKKRWHNVKIRLADSEAHPSLQWEFETDSEENISGEFYNGGTTFHVFENESIGHFSRWIRSIIPLEYDLVLYMNDLSHHPITLYEGIKDEEIQNGFSVPFDIDKYKSIMD